MEKHINELKLGNLSHMGIDVVSAVSDFFSFGAIGPAVDIIHGAIYLHEWDNETDEVEKSILLIEAIITFASALLPFAFQALAGALKKSVRFAKTSGKVLPEVSKGVNAMIKKVMPKLKSIKKMTKREDIERLAMAIKKAKPDATVEALKGYAYMAALAKRFGMDGMRALDAPESVAEKAYEALTVFSKVDLDNIYLKES